MSVRVVVADDHAVVREGLRALLGAVDGYTIVGTAATGREAVRAAVTLRPDVLVLDINMPDGSGIEAARKVTREAPGVAVLMLTMFDDDDSVFAAVRAGARGYVLKGANRDELKAAVRSVAAGQAVFGPGVASRVLDRMTRPVGVETEFPQLTPRERAVLELMVADLGPAAIARRLGIAVKTVRNNISSILTKLHVTERSAAVDAARSAGIGPVPDEGGDPTRGGR
jgi:DNA-binding NarL/FixJ family response regulator